MSAISLLVGLFFIAIPITILAAIFIVLYLNQRRRTQNIVKPGRWKAVTALITAASVEEAPRGLPGDEASYYPSIQFEYTEEGRVHQGTQAVGRPYPVISRAWQTLEHYKVGRQITVYCNPDNPREARLWVE